MAKAVKTKVRIQISGAAATPAPPVASSLGPHGVNLMDFCKKFNAMTASRKGETVPTLVTIYEDRSFDILVKTPPVTELIKKKLNIQKGSSRPNTDKVGSISWRDIEDIAKVKLPDLNALDIEQAKKIVAGSARSMGVDVVG